MGRGQNDLGVKADSLLNFRRQVPQHGPGGLDGLEDAARQTQLFDQCIVPVPAVRAHQRRGAGVRVLIGGHAAEQVVQVIGHHQERFGGGQLLRVLFFERHQLVDRVERLVLDAGAGVVVGKGQAVFLFQRLADALGALVAVGDGVADALIVRIQQHKIDGPGVDADGRGGKTCVVCSLQAVDDLLREGVDVPAEVAVLAVDAVFEAVDLLQGDFSVLHGAYDVPPAGRADVDCQCTGLHKLSPSLQNNSVAAFAFCLHYTTPGLGFPSAKEFDCLGKFHTFLSAFPAVLSGSRAGIIRLTRPVPSRIIDPATNKGDVTLWPPRTKAVCWI